MAKITLLPVADPLDGSEDVPIVQQGETRRINPADHLSYIALGAEIARDQAADLVLPQNIFLDVALAVAEAAVAPDIVFKLVDSATGLVDVRKRTVPGSDLLYREATAAALASTNSGKGAGQIGYSDTAAYANDKAGYRLNILSATRRPAMDGIFSSGANQRAALLAFVTNAAATGKTIEWGPLDVSLDVETATGGRRGLTVPTGSRWIFHPNTVIRALPSVSSTYEVLNLWDVSDIVIEGAGARIIGDKVAHAGVTGEQGKGVSLRGTTNIKIRDLNISDCWGDCVYVGAGTQAFCENTLLQNVTGLRARRNGLSIISVKGFRSLDCEFSDSIGTDPQFGVDIEPNGIADFLQGIVFERLRTRNNVGYGIGIALQAMVGTANQIDIAITDHVDDGSASGIIGAVDNGIAGRVDIIRPVSKNARGPAILLRRKASNGPLWTITEPTAIDWNRAASASQTTSSAILLYAPTGDLGTEALGNLDIIRPNIRPLSSGTAANAIAIAEQRTTTPDRAEKIRVIDPVNLGGLPCRVEGITTFSDPNRTSVRLLTDAATSIGRTSFGKHIYVPALTANRFYDVADDPLMATGTEFIWELTGAGAGQCRIRFAAGVSLFPDALGAALYIASNTKGARLRIRKSAAQEWTIMEKIGTWVTA